MLTNNGQICAIFALLKEKNAFSFRGGFAPDLLGTGGGSAAPPITDRHYWLDHAVRCLSHTHFYDEVYAYARSKRCPAERLFRHRFDRPWWEVHGRGFRGRRGRKAP